jgi:hypothetical protein
MQQGASNRAGSRHIHCTPASDAHRPNSTSSPHQVLEDGLVDLRRDEVHGEVARQQVLHHRDQRPERVLLLHEQQHRARHEVHALQPASSGCQPCSTLPHRHRGSGVWGTRGISLKVRGFWDRMPRVRSGCRRRCSYTPFEECQHQAKPSDDQQTYTTGAAPGSSRRPRCGGSRRPGCGAGRPARCGS